MKTKHTPEQKTLAISTLRSFEVSMGDSWRHDFCESVEEAQQDDDLRREEMIEQVAKDLGCSNEDAERFYENNRFD
jgi:hypothetical protein